MTYKEKLLREHPELLTDFIPEHYCPSRFGYADPEFYDCEKMACEDCWNREAPGSLLSEIRVMLDPGAKLPTRGHAADAGLDLYSREAVVIAPHNSAVFDTGVHVAIPRGYAGILISKSGLNVKHDTLSDGLIDADYTGSIAVKLYNHGDRELHIAAGQKISQLVILPIITPEPVLAEELEQTERGSGGFGSTGAF